MITAWPITMLKQLAEKLFMVLARVAERWLSEFQPQLLANTAWAFVRVKQLVEKLVTVLARAAEPQDLAKVHLLVLWHRELELPLQLSSVRELPRCLPCRQELHIAPAM